MVATAETIDQVQSLAGTYKYGFVTDIETELAPKGLSEDIVRFISAKKNEPEWLLQWRLDAYAKWLEMDEPDWSKLNYEPIDYQDAYYYAAPKSMEDAPESLDDVDPALIETYNKLGIPLHERDTAGVKNPVAVDVVFDSVSVATTFRDKLAEQAVIFMSIGEAVHEHPELVKSIWSVVPTTDAVLRLNSAVFTDGSFVYIPKGVRCPWVVDLFPHQRAKHRPVRAHIDCCG